MDSTLSPTAAPDRGWCRRPRGPELFHGPDGTTIAFRRFGRTGGCPVLVHHGLIGGDHVDPGWADCASWHGLELIAVARPGYAASTPADLDDIASWVPYCAPLLDVLGLPTVSVVGIGDGVPYALAVAALLPARVRGVVAVTGRRRDGLAVPAPEAAYLRRHLAATRRELPAEHPWQPDLLAASAFDGAGPALTVALRRRPWGFDRAEVRAPVWRLPGGHGPAADRIFAVLAADLPVPVRPTA